MVKVKIKQHFFGGPRGRTEYRPGEEVEVSNVDADIFVRNGQATIVEAEQRASKGGAR